MSEEELVLRPDLPVRAQPPGPGEGRLGPLLVDQDLGTLYALTCAQLLPIGSSLAVSAGPFAGTCISNGPPILGLDRASAVQDAHQLIAAVPLQRLLIGLEAYPVARDDEGTAAVVAPRDQASSSRLIGKELFVYSGQGVRRRASVVSADSQFSMPNPLTDQLTTFDNALELTPLDDGALISEGEVGSLVMTPRGDWVAIVVAGRHDVAYAAPVQPVMARLGLNIIGVPEIEAHNESLTKAPEEAEPDPLSKKNGQYSQASQKARDEADLVLAL